VRAAALFLMFAPSADRTNAVVTAVVDDMLVHFEHDLDANGLLTRLAAADGTPLADRVTALEEDLGGRCPEGEAPAERPSTVGAGTIDDRVGALERIDEQCRSQPVPDAGAAPAARP
jgi:hypothetical protein